MGTLRDELAKLPSLDSLRFDDDPPKSEPPAVAEVATAPKASAESVKPMQQRVWEWLKANPASTTADVSAALELEPITASQAIYNLRTRSLAERIGKKDGAYQYSAVGDSYGVTAEGTIRKHMAAAWARRRELAAQRRASSNAEPPPAQTVHIQKEFNIDALLDTLSVTQARALYDRLSKLFTG